MNDDETRAAAYRQSQADRCRADHEREERLRGSQSAYDELYNKTKALRRDDGYEGYSEEGCRENPEQLAN